MRNFINYKSMNVPVFAWLASMLPIFTISCVMTPAARFERAVEDASAVEEKDIYDGLVAITPENNSIIWNDHKTKVLVVMWKNRRSFNLYYKGKSRTDPSEDNVTWVTAVPQVKGFARNYIKKFPSASKDEIDLRLKQYLGLKPERTYDVFVEMWVAPEDLFRPCTDPEIDDAVCNIAFSESAPEVKGIACYPCFYKNLYFKDFRTRRTRPGIPWSGMGYTYDWGDLNSPFGASEFILVPEAHYEIVRVVETIKYIKP